MLELILWVVLCSRAPVKDMSPDAERSLYSSASTSNTYWLHISYACACAIYIERKKLSDGSRSICITVTRHASVRLNMYWPFNASTAGTRYIEYFVPGANACSIQLAMNYFTSMTHELHIIVSMSWRRLQHIHWNVGILPVHTVPFRVKQHSAGGQRGTRRRMAIRDYYRHTIQPKYIPCCGGDRRHHTGG